MPILIKRLLTKQALVGGLLASIALSGSLLAQGTKTDYENAASLRERTRGKVSGDRIKVHWIDGSECLWYRADLGNGKSEYRFVNSAEGTNELAFEHRKLSDSIVKSTNLKSMPNRLPIRNLQIDSAQTQIQFTAGGTAWTCDLSNYDLVDKAKDSTDATSDGSLPSLTSIQRSSGQGEDTYLRFVNQLDESVDIFWVAGDGSRRKYADLAPGKSHDQHTFGGHVWLVMNKKNKPVAVFRATNQNRDAVIDGTVEIKERSERRQRSQLRRKPESQSPDGKWSASIVNNNIQLRELKTDETFSLSGNGTDENPYQSNFHWSPDSSKLVAIQEQVGEKREVHIVEAAPKDQLQPKLHTMVYAKPGDKLAIAKPRLFDIPSKKQIAVDDRLFPNPWRISDVRWKSDSSRFTFFYNQRGHQVLRIIVVDAATGESAAVVDEVSETFIDYAYKSLKHYLDPTNELIWMSERDGWNHLYLYDTRTGDVKNQITKGSWVVRGVERVDDEQRRIYFRASGVYPEQDPYYLHYGFVDFDGSNLTWLTSGNGTHKIEYSPSGEHFIDTYSRVDMPTVTELRRSGDGTKVCEFGRGDHSALLSAGWQSPERFVAKGRNGKTDIYGVIYRPSNFDESKTYPVIEKIYAGPHGSFVPKSFAPYRRAQSYAELGFIVVQIDGMGTSNRSKAFHDVCWKNLGDSGFPDRILWMQAAAKKYPQMDISRVGIFGGSAGGQSTLRALLAFGDFYKVGVADCGCHDNRMDKVWWNELWMGWPIGPHYEEQSNVTQAHRLTGKLLLTVGELDKNVDPASTMQVVDALIKADKDFDFLIVPGAGHGVGESPYANRRRQDFFVRHLIGVEPRSE